MEILLFNYFQGPSFDMFAGSRCEHVTNTCRVVSSGIWPFVYVCVCVCVCSYEKSNTHRFEVPRMLFDDPEQLGRYIIESNDTSVSLGFF